MFHLYDDLPTTVDVDDVEYRLNLSFDVVILACEALEDKEMTNADRLETFLSLLVIGQLPDQENWRDLFSALIGVLYPSSQRAVEYDQNGDPMPTKTQNTKRDFDFYQDSQEIYAGFRQAYGIDLIEEQGHMHWYKFIALLAGLPDDTKFARIREVRNTKLSDIKDKAERSRMATLKRQLALPDTDDLEEGGDEYGS